MLSATDLWESAALLAICWVELGASLAFLVLCGLLKLMSDTDSPQWELAGPTSRCGVGVADQLDGRLRWGTLGWLPTEL